MLWHRMAKLFTSKTDMAVAKPEVEWFYHPDIYWETFGLLNLAGKWAVVKKKGIGPTDNFDLVTDWVDDRQTAIGFLKLLKEQ